MGEYGYCYSVWVFLESNCDSELGCCSGLDIKYFGKIWMSDVLALKHTGDIGISMATNRQGLARRQDSKVSTREGIGGCHKVRLENDMECNHQGF